MTNSHKTLDLKSLLQKANITKVIAIDDYSCSADAFLVDFSTQWELDSDGSKKNTILNSLQIDSSGNEEINFYKCRDRIQEELAGPNRKEIILMVKEAFPDINDDQKVYSIITDVLSDAGVNFVEMTPSKWKEKPDISSDPDRRHWILIDIELEKDKNYSGRNGVELLVSEKKNSLNDEKADLWNCNYISILTHTVALNTEEEKHLELIAKYSELDIADFCTLSKQRIDSLEDFQEGLEISIVNRYTSLIKNAYAQKIKNATQKALGEFERLIPSAIYHSTRTKASKEGCSELEVLRRVFDVKLDQSLGAALEDLEFQKTNRVYFDRLGEVISNDWEPKSGHFRDKLVEHMYSEYFQGDIVNKLNSPIANGDIFRFEKADYILLAQPCDLMIRGEGTEENARKPRVVSLYKIVKCQPDKNQPGISCDGINRTRLPFWNDNKDQYVIYYKDYIQLNIQLLDLVSLNSGGRCFLEVPSKVTNLISPLEGVRKTLDDLLSRTKEVFEKRFGTFNDLRNQIMNLKKDSKGQLDYKNNELLQLLSKPADYANMILAELFLPIVLNSTLLPDHSQIQKGIFDFKLQRINRLREPFAANHLLLLSQNQARPADPMPMV